MNEYFGGVIERGNTVPQNVALRRAENKCALVDSKIRHGTEAEERIVVLLSLIGVRSAKGVKIDPLLTACGNILAFIFTDRTMCGMSIGYLIGRPAGFA